MATYTKTQLQRVTANMSPQQKIAFTKNLISQGNTIEGLNQPPTAKQPNYNPQTGGVKLPTPPKPKKVPFGAPLQAGEGAFDRFGERFLSNLNPFSNPVLPAEYEGQPESERTVVNPIGTGAKAAVDGVRVVGKGVLTASAGPFLAGARTHLEGLESIDRPLEVPFFGNINPAANTPMEQAGQAIEFGATALPMVNPYTSALAGAGYGAAGGAGREMQNPNATPESIAGAATFGGATGALFSPQTMQGVKNFFKDKSNKLFSKVIPQTSKTEQKVLNTNLDMAKELQDRGIWGTTKQLQQKGQDLKSTALRNKSLILDKADDIGLTLPKKELVKEIRTRVMKDVTPEVGSVKRFNNLLDNIADDINSGTFGRGSTMTLKQADKLRANLQKAAKGAFGTEGSQGKEVYKAASRAIKELTAEVAPMLDDISLSSVRQDTRVGSKLIKEMSDQIAKNKTKKLFSMSDMYTSTPAALLGGSIAGPYGAAAAGIGAKATKSAVNSNLFKSGVGQFYNRLGNLPLPTQSMGIPQNFMRGLIYGNDQSSLNQP